MRTLRKPIYWPYIRQIQHFYDDCKNGTLPDYSFLEPRWFTLTNLGASDEHPPHDVSIGENLIADIYEAVRASPLWEKTLLIVTFDEHGGFYDHVPTPTQNVPNPDGIDSKNPPFDFTRLGVRVPTIMASPWIKAGSVFHAPTASEIPEGQVGSQFEHSSVCASIKNLFNLPSFLTNRDAWAATFHNTIVNSEYPRVDCPTLLPVPGGSEAREAYKRAESTPVTKESILRDESLGNISTLPLSDLQYEILQIANGINGGKFDIYQLKTEHEGALFIRESLNKFFD
jgi:phospholipase C